MTRTIIVLFVALAVLLTAAAVSRDTDPGVQRAPQAHIYRTETGGYVVLPF